MPRHRAPAVGPVDEAAAARAAAAGLANSSRVVVATASAVEVVVTAVRTAAVVVWARQTGAVAASAQESVAVGALAGQWWPRNPCAALLTQ